MDPTGNGKFLRPITWPYFWALEQFTILPMRRVMRSARDDSQLFKSEAERFVRGKLSELNFVILASTLSAAANLAVFSWSKVEESMWLAFGMWYFSLILAIHSLISAGQQTAVLQTLVTQDNGSLKLLYPDDVLKLVTRSSKKLDKESQTPRSVEAQSSSEPTTKTRNESKSSIIIMMYVWQTPVMLQAWSVLTLLVGLVIHVTGPLSHNPPGLRDWRSAVFFLTGGIVAVFNFAFSSFWLYRSAKGFRDANHSEATDSGLPSPKETTAPLSIGSFSPLKATRTY